jgi:hypothetical protein
LKLEFTYHAADRRLVKQITATASREILIARMRRPRKIQHAMRVLRSCRVQRTFHLATVRFGLGEAR